MRKFTFTETKTILATVTRHQYGIDRENSNVNTIIPQLNIEQSEQRKKCKRKSPSHRRLRSRSLIHSMDFGLFFFNGTVCLNNPLKRCSFTLRMHFYSKLFSYLCVFHKSFIFYLLFTPGENHSMFQ